MARGVGQGVPYDLADLDRAGLVDQQHLPRFLSQDTLLMRTACLLEEWESPAHRRAFVGVRDLRLLVGMRRKEHLRCAAAMTADCQLRTAAALGFIVETDGRGRVWQCYQGTSKGKSRCARVHDV